MGLTGKEVPVQVRVALDRDPVCAVVPLDDQRAADAKIVGAKAAALARASSAGLPVLAGFVISTTADPSGDAPLIREAWEVLSDGGHRSLVVRSSSTVEDASAESLAGCFDSVVDVRGWERFRVAVDQVRESAARAGSAPMGVLVQRYLASVIGGVLFGADPITGDDRCLVVECVQGTPGALVAGTETADRYVLGPTGRLRLGASATIRLDRPTRRSLAGLARDTRRLFGAPQDIEWAKDAEGRIWLLQSRPITAAGQFAAVGGPTYGPGPIAETFPEPLRRLEQDLFVDPLRDGITGALRAIGVVAARRLARSSPVIVVRGRVAADLELLGWSRGRRRRFPALLNPVSGARRLAAAWHVGRLAQLLPGVSERLVADVDARLAAVGSVERIPDAELVTMLSATRANLVAVHAHQVLAGMLLPQAPERGSASVAALRALSDGRARDLDDATIVARSPAVLALVPPRIGLTTPALPPIDAAIAVGDRIALAPREALRLRARWLDELAARAASELGRRLAASGVLASADRVRELSFDELAAVVAGAPAPQNLAERGSRPDGPPLPSKFRLTAGGAPVAVRTDEMPTGRAAGGGRGDGRVVHADDPGDVTGAVLVTQVLAPTLAPRVPGLAGLVSETGSSLSHLAIVAREHSVPTVVAVDGALERFPVGSHVLVDGTTGEVRRLDDERGGPP
jgi:pyruvate,water dikinase